MSERVLALPAPPPDRGRFLRVDEVRAMLGNGPTRDWCYTHIPHKVTVSRKLVGWFEHDVRRWLEERRN